MSQLNNLTSDSLESLLLDNTSIKNINLDKSNFFEPVKIDVPLMTDIDDKRISSLFGEEHPEENENGISSIIYEKVKEDKPKFYKNPKFIKGSIAGALALGIIGTFAVNSFFTSDSNGFVADASPLPMIMNQNVKAKTELVKKQIDAGEVYNDSNVLLAYKVKEDDSIEKIAQKSNVTTEALKVINAISSNEDLAKKQTIMVPTMNGTLHKIVSGETLGVIAEKYKTTVEKILYVNKLKNQHFINIDQVLFIPSENKPSENKPVAVVNKKETSKTVSGASQPVTIKIEKVTKSGTNVSREEHRIHKIAPGQTFESLAKQYNVPLQKIIDANRTIDPANLQLGQPVIIPGKAVNRNQSRSRGAKLSNRSLAVGYNNGARFSGRMFWPATGEFSSGFGPRWGSFHRGIDIAADVGTPIYSAMEGVVTHVGHLWDYGLAVEITHPNGMVTRYGHCSKIFVKVGQRINAGQHIAAIGRTGRATGPHVHFEVIVNGVQVNPRNYL